MKYEIVYSFTLLISTLTVLATAVMAASAAIQGARQEFDPFGATVLAIVTAVGGGTLRDLLIGATPVFWIKDLTYLATAVPVGMLTFMFAGKLQQGNERRLRLLMYLDAIGLALFTLVGVQVALANEIPFVSAVVLGCITGVAGGMFRDVLCGLTPSILKQDLYATISLGGGIFYIVTRPHMPNEVSLAIAFALMTTIRFVVIYRGRPKGA
ncbi:MAG: trimeric intracellular cation channel family protein [Hyphomicrobiales bacterium]